MPPLPEDLDRLLHDLRGPLNSAVMHLEIVRRGAPGDGASKQSLDTIQQELGRLAAMLPAAFSVVALERGPVVRLDLRRLVERALAEHGLTAVTVEAAPWPDVVGDERLLSLAVAHLVRNALEATAAAGGARCLPQVSAARTGAGDVILVVRDWGAGLPSTNPKILIRLGAGRRPGRAGTGLVTVERVARLHGGELTFAAPGDGAEVRLRLPAAGR
jgi:two-component system, NtrC family, sensor histidine kinase HydH